LLAHRSDWKTLAGVLTGTEGSLVLMADLVVIVSPGAPLIRYFDGALALSADHVLFPEPPTSTRVTPLVVAAIVSAAALAGGALNGAWTSATGVSTLPARIAVSLALWVKERRAERAVEAT